MSHLPYPKSFPAHVVGVLQISPPNRRSTPLLPNLPALAAGNAAHAAVIDVHPDTRSIAAILRLSRRKQVVTSTGIERIQSTGCETARTHEGRPSVPLHSSRRRFLLSSQNAPCESRGHIDEQELFSVNPAASHSAYSRSQPPPCPVCSRYTVSRPPDHCNPVYDGTATSVITSTLCLPSSRLQKVSISSEWRP